MMPRRVRSVLDAVRALVDERLVAAIGKALDETEQQLFRNAEHARSNADQQGWFDALRELRRGRADVAPRFLVAFEARLLKAPSAASAAEAPRTRHSADDLDLVNPDELETRLILEDGAARAEVRLNEALHALGHRFGVLWASPPLPPGEVPVGPGALNHCLSVAIAELRLNPPAMQTLLRVYDRVLLQGGGELLEAINELLVRHGVLPNFGGYGVRRREVRPAAEPATPPAEPAAPEAAEPIVTTPAAPERSAAPAAPAAEDAEVPWTVEDQARFDALRAVIAGMRGPRDLPPDSAGQTVEVGPADLQTVLSHLQSIPNPAQLVGGRRVPQSVGHIRQAMLEQLARTLPEGSRPALRPQDDDVLDLMEAFLGTLQHDLRPDPATEQVLARLQVPLVRMALQDHSFFTRADHPARLLLNSVADASTSWLEDDPDGRRMLERLGAIGDRISAEFQEGVGLFQELFGELTTHVRQTQRRAEAAERRHVEAARGRERLALARRTVDEALATRIAARAPDELLRTTLEQAWADVLALTLLRHGVESEAYRRRLSVVDRLLSLRERGAATPAEAKAIRDEVEAGLALIGYHLADIRQVMERLLGEIHGTEDPNEVATLAMRMRARVRLGERRVGEGAEGVESPVVSTPEEQAWIERVRELPIGTWFAPGSGEGQRMKLAWRSDALGQVLLVNRRATSAEERSVTQLARELARGTWRIVLAAPTPPVERVFQRILGRQRPSADGAFHA
jgi:hypothetical protein